MKSLLKKIGICILLFTQALPIVASAHGPSMQTAASYAYFSDVERNHYAYDAIIWAHRKKIISGYGDGRFGPNDDVTEAQAAKMLANYFHLKDTYGNLKKETKSAHWADEYYDALAQYAVPLNGYFHNNIRNQPIKRGVVAQALAYIADGRTNLRESIEFLLFNRITTGQNPEYQYTNLEKFFGVSNHLTRAQIVTFLYRMENEGFHKLSEKIEMPNGESINQLAATGKNYVDSRLRMTEPTAAGGYVPKAGLTLIYAPSFLTDEKETFKVVKEDGCIKLVNTNSSGFDYCYMESAESLILGVADTDWIFFNLTYPMQQGKYVKDKQYNFDYLRETYERVYVESTKETVKLKAGTFYNVVVLLYDSGERLYFAKDVGLIKAADSEGNVIIELNSIK